MKKIYILQLLNNKYYIGITSNLERRICEHFDGKGASWTKINKPIKVIDTLDCISKFDEDKYTKKYMDKFGIDNVRGGSYSNIILTDWQTKALDHEFKTSNDLCFNCGKSGHFASECYKFDKKN